MNAPTEGAAYDVAVARERLYVAAWSAGLEVFDIADPAAPTRLGGAPTRSTNNGCIAGCLRQLDTRGLWIFARDPFPPTGAVNAIDDYAVSLGLDTSTMIPNIHEGCTYDFLDEEDTNC